MHDRVGLLLELTHETRCNATDFRENKRRLIPGFTDFAELSSFGQLSVLHTLCNASFTPSISWTLGQPLTVFAFSKLWYAGHHARMICPRRSYRYDMLFIAAAEWHLRRHVVKACPLLRCVQHILVRVRVHVRRSAISWFSSIVVRSEITTQTTAKPEVYASPASCLGGRPRACYGCLTRV